jgi:murein L,D-transpeptidase YafK
MIKWSTAAIFTGLLTIGALGCRQVAKSSVINRTGGQVGATSTVESSQQPDRQPLKLPLENPRILIHKAQRKLELYSGDALLRTYKAGLGFSPVADKKQAGDGATPEGAFYVFVKNNRSAYYLSLGLSYPNAEDADRGLRDGLINRTQHRAITEALRKRIAPPQYTKLGGLIYIHGHGARSDWTWGCVALENDDIRELFDAVKVGTSVTIVP